MIKRNLNQFVRPWVKKKVFASAISRKRPEKFLLMSLPRSGSTWLGDALSSYWCANYFNEPLNYLYLSANGNTPSVFKFDSAPLTYRYAAWAAFSGIPAFQNNIIGDFRPERRRVLVKEINPWALRSVCEMYDPKVIFLVRNPIEVASSFFTAGFGASFAGRQLLSRNLDQEYSVKGFDHLSQLQSSPIIENAALQGLTLRRAFSCLLNFPKSIIVSYDFALCNSKECFKDLSERLNVEEFSNQTLLAGNVSIERKERWKETFSVKEVRDFWRVFFETCGSDVKSYCEKEGWLIEQ